MTPAQSDHRVASLTERLRFGRFARRQGWTTMPKGH